MKHWICEDGGGGAGAAGERDGACCLVWQVVGQEGWWYEPKIIGKIQA